LDLFCIQRWDPTILSEWIDERKKAKERLPYGAFTCDKKRMMEVLVEYTNRMQRMPLYDLLKRMNLTKPIVDA